MTLQQFRSLQLKIQEKLLINRAVFLFERRAVGVKVLLYQLNSFYVEVFYDTSTSQVCQLKSFTDINGLDAYLHKIDISEIVALLK